MGSIPSAPAELLNKGVACKEFAHDDISNHSYDDDVVVITTVVVTIQY